MPDTAIDWLNAYNRMFQQAAQPLIAYNLEKKRLAEQSRLRQEQLDDQERIIDYHARAQGNLEEKRLAMETEATRKALREQKLAEARSKGITADVLPEDASYSDIVVALAKSKGRQLTEAAKAASAAVKAYADYRGERADAIIKRQAARAIGMVTPAELKAAKITQADINAILDDPDKINDMLAKAASAKNDKASALLNRINGEMAAGIEAAMIAEEKANPRLSGLSESFKMAHDNFIALQKEGGYDEASGIAASNALISDVFQGSQKKSPIVPPLPPRTTAVPGPALPTGPQEGVAFPGIVPTAMKVAGMIPEAARPLTAPFKTAAGDVWSLIAGGQLKNPMAETLGMGHAFPELFPSSTNVGMGAGAPVNNWRDFLRLMTMRRLQAAAQNQASTNAAYYPTAFPPVNVPGMPGYPAGDVPGITP